MKHSKLYAAIGMITLCLFSMSLFVSAQPQAGSSDQAQLNQRDPGKMGRPGMRPAFAQGNVGRSGNKPGPDRGGKGMRINWQELGLSEEQQEQLRQIQREFRVNTAAIREELRYTQQDLQTEMRKETVDQAKIDSLLNEIASLKQRLSEAETQNFLAIKGILTQEQVEKLAALRQPLPPQLRGVELSDEQRVQIGTIMKESREKSQVMRDELRDLKEELQELLLASGETDAAKVQQIQANITAKEVALEKERVDVFLKLKALLTPEQQEQLKQNRLAKREKGAPRGRQGK